MDDGSHKGLIWASDSSDRPPPPSPVSPNLDLEDEDDENSIDDERDSGDDGLGYAIRSYPSCIPACKGKAGKFIYNIIVKNKLGETIFSLVEAVESMDEVPSIEGIARYMYLYTEQTVTLRACLDRRF